MNKNDQRMKDDDDNDHFPLILDALFGHRSVFRP